MNYPAVFINDIRISVGAEPLVDLRPGRVLPVLPEGAPMTDKYGRLFTEADVGELIRTAYEMGRRSGDPRAAPDGMSHPDLAEVLATGRAAMTFPVDEPLFLLRGQDANALSALDEYERSLLRFEQAPARPWRGALLLSQLNAIRADMDDATYDAVTSSVAQARDAMEQWQRANLDRVKAPD